MKHLKGSKLTWLILAALAIIAIAIGFLVHPGTEEHGYWFTHIYGFYAGLGFLGCAAMIYLAKWLGHYWLQRKEDYYD
jgi:uncharacterized membrane protein YobD (UPF0266 family)